MLYSEKDIESVKSILESSEAGELLDSLDNLLVNYPFNISDIIEDALESYKRRTMRIKKVTIKKKGNEVQEFLAIEIDDKDTDTFSLYKVFPIEKGISISIEAIHCIAELSNLGYDLVIPNKYNEIIEVGDKDKDKEEYELVKSLLLYFQ